MLNFKYFTYKLSRALRGLYASKMLFRGGGGIRRSLSEDQVRSQFFVREITVYMLSLEHARTSLVLIVVLFIESFIPTWSSPVVRHSL